MEQVFADVRRRACGAPGTTVLLSSHILSEVERLADRVTIIRDGRAVETGTLDEMRHLRRSRVRGRRSIGRRPRPGRRLAGVHDLAIDGPRWPAPSTPTRCPSVLTALTAAGVTHAHQHAAHARGAVPRRLPRASPR